MSETARTNESQTPGQRLVEAREREGLSQEQVAQTLNIQLKKVQALEEDNYHLLFSEVFARGYLRSCAKLLRLDGEELVRLYDQHYALEREVELPANNSLDLPIKAASPWPARMLLIVVIVLAWVLAYWYFSPPTGEADRVPVVDTPQGETEALPAEPTAALLDRVAVSSSAASSIQAQPAALDEPVAEDTAKELDTLALAFDQECWLEVLDARGDALAAELQLAGSRLTLTGEAPFTVKLGNHAQGVSAWVNGERQVLPERAASAVATFQLDAE